MSDETPPDLAGLRLWIARLVRDYEQIAEAKKQDLTKRELREYRKALTSIQQACAGQANGAGKDRIRELVAAGVVSYASKGHELPRELVPEQLIIDLAVHSLWPLIVVPNLPKTYFKDLTEVSSEPIARLVAHARLSRTTGSLMTAQTFGRALAAVQFAPGVLNLLNDLADPKRGGCAFAAITLANTGSLPPHKSYSKAAVLWVLSAAVVGVIGNRADALLTSLITWLDENASSSSGSSSHHAYDHHGSASFEPHGHHHSGSNQNEGLARIVEDFLRDVF